MDKPTEQQVREFWEWCGFKFYEGMPFFRLPNGGEYSHHIPPIDLNNLFKYAVPKVRDDMKWTEWFDFMVSWAIKLYDKKDPALALFWALWQVKTANEAK